MMFVCEGQETAPRATEGLARLCTLRSPRLGPARPGLFVLAATGCFPEGLAYRGAKIE